jgi:hypothetical protein
VKLKKCKILLSSKQYAIIKERSVKLNEFIDSSGSFIEGGDVTNGTEVTTNTMNDFGNLPQTGDGKAEQMGKDFNWNNPLTLSQSFRRLTEDLNNEDVVVDKGLDLNDPNTLNSEPYNKLGLYRSLSTFLSDLENEQNGDVSQVDDINNICINAIKDVLRRKNI